MTVTAKDLSGLKAISTCILPTYDTTLPSGRLSPDFVTTSHPHILKASLVATDESELVEQKVMYYGNYYLYTSPV